MSIGERAFINLEMMEEVVKDNFIEGKLYCLPRYDLQGEHSSQHDIMQMIKSYPCGVVFKTKKGYCLSYTYADLYMEYNKMYTA